MRLPGWKISLWHLAEFDRVESLIEVT